MGSINFKDSIIDGISGTNKTEIIETATPVTHTISGWTPTTRISNTSGNAYYYYLNEGPYKSGIVLNNFTGRITTSLWGQAVSSYKSAGYLYEIRVGNTVLGKCTNSYRNTSSPASVNYDVTGVSGEILMYPATDLATTDRYGSVRDITISGTQKTTQEIITKSQIDKVYIGTEQIYPYVNPILDSVYEGWWNSSATGTSIEKVILEMESATVIKGTVVTSAGTGWSWYFKCNYVQNSTLANPCVGFDAGGTAERRYELFWSRGKNCYVWYDRNITDDTNTSKYRYIMRTQAEVINSTNLAGLVQ